MFSLPTLYITDQEHGKIVNNAIVCTSLDLHNLLSGKYHHVLQSDVFTGFGGIFVYDDISIDSTTANILYKLLRAGGYVFVDGITSEIAELLYFSGLQDSQVNGLHFKPHWSGNSSFVLGFTNDARVKKGACADCTCGRKDAELSKATDIKSFGSCGSCGLGDKYRCETCPYRGLPAFEHDGKVLVSTANDL